MNILTAHWSEYELLDSGNGMRLERFGQYKIVRPDPQALWKPHLQSEAWNSVDAVFEQESKGSGRWVRKTQIPDSWTMKFHDIEFSSKLTPFKHTGVFPEQSIHWEWIEERFKIHDLRFKNNNEVNILNLFAYTGIASLVCANAGAKVTHVDASRPTIGWARENQTKSGLQDKPIRWILDDAIKFVQREVKRGVRYDGIIMDPPVYGHGPHGEPWDFNKDFSKLLDVCQQVLSENPLFIIINAYAVSASALMLENMLHDLQLPGTIEAGELTLEERQSKRLLSTGIFARWTRE